MSDLNQAMDPPSDAAQGGVDSPSSIQDLRTAQERRNRAAERLGAEIQTWPRDAEASDLTNVDADLDGDHETSASVLANGKALEAEIEAEAETVMPGMSLVSISRVQHPHLRAAALLMTDMCALSRSGLRGDLELMVHSVGVPEAGNLGEMAHGAYAEARDARTPGKQAAFAKKLKARTRDLIGFGRFALAEKAIELTLAASDGDIAAEPTAT